MPTDTPAPPLVLVVEDDENHAELISRSFEAGHERYRLERARSLAEAACLIERCVPDLVLTDYRLPDGDGNAVVAMVKELCPVIIMTSQGNEQVAASTMKAGAKDYLVKSPDVFLALPGIVKMALAEWDLVKERRRTYEAVARGKREWEQTFEAVSDLIFIIDAGYTITRVNRAMASRFNLEPDELTGRRCCELMHSTAAPPEECPVFRALASGREHSEELEVHGCLLEISVSPLYDEEGCITAFVHVARDVTERRKAERERLCLEQQLQQTQKLESLGVLAGGIAHDFNNILMIILGHCMLAQENLDSRAAVEAHFQHIDGAARRAADLCRQMLAYAGRSPLVQTQVSIRPLVDEMVRMLRSAIRKNVSFTLDLASEVPAVHGDQAQIQQVVMNLIMNAAEALGDGAGTVKIAVAEREVAEDAERDFLGVPIPAGRYACVVVADTGCGMDEETRKRIFEPFFTTKLAGRGLGMSAVLGIIKSHGGALKLCSAPGAGTTFTVYFPLSADGDEGEPVQTPPSPPATTPRGTVLLVDDEAQLRLIGGKLLRSMGFSTITASNGREALEIYRARGSSIDLLLIDLVMPEMGGLQTYTELRKIAPTIPVVICSGYDGDEVASSIESDEHAVFAAKPYQPEQLRELLTRLLAPLE
ncbi:response regulator [Geomonas sp. RF6]|uniref:hybrid sensor histidine kinase/response regulator n=1 Tax=Geomonas sp. RF6 TaxID=2897342 RepID=UPI001E5B87FC|nr:response regulator [Geomonas sp. RF6]UFS71693.1 response regulator [Geomonas sp. RF6]